jgi:putative flippase GtrA
MKVTHQFLLYITGGVISAIIDMGIMQLLIFMSINPLIAATVGFFTGLLVNYSFHSHLTFMAATSLSVSLRFISVVGINYFITIVFVYLSLLILNVALIGKIVSLPVIAVNGFVLSRHWVFR